jgi:hypothetical protein
MTIRQGTILGQVYGGAGQTGKQNIRCQYSGVAVSGDLIVFGDTLLGTGLSNNEFQQTLPQGADLLDATLRVSDASSSVGMEAGYAAADGSASTTNGVADVNASYFLGATAISASGITRATGPVTVIKCQRPTNPTVTITSGAVGSEAVIELDVEYTYHSNDNANVVEDS